MSFATKITRLAVALSCAGIGMSAAQSAASLKLKQTIPLPGVEAASIISHSMLWAKDGSSAHLARIPSRCWICVKTSEFARSLALAHRKESFTSQNLIACLLRMTKLGFSRSTMEKSFRETGELNFKDDADNVRYDDATKKICHS